jgi:hypothetical protein
MSRLYDALRRAEAERDRVRHGGPELPALARTPRPRQRPRIKLREALQLPPFARGLLIFASGAALALAAVQLAPRLRPASPLPATRTRPAFVASPASLKLDYRLDLTRTGDAAR